VNNRYCEQQVFLFLDQLHHMLKDMTAFRPVSFVSLLFRSDIPAGKSFDWGQRKIAIIHPVPKIEKPSGRS